MNKVPALRVNMIGDRFLRAFGLYRWHLGDLLLDGSCCLLVLGDSL